jgi:hypothetical protein
MQTIKINRGIYTNTLNENEVTEILTQNSFLKSILLMVLNDSDNWENEHEAEFNRNQAYDYLLNYNVFKGYSKQYIKKSLNKIIKK